MVHRLIPAFPRRWTTTTKAVVSNLDPRPENLPLRARAAIPGYPSRPITPRFHAGDRTDPLSSRKGGSLRVPARACARAQVNVLFRLIV